MIQEQTPVVRHTLHQQKQFVVTKHSLFSFIDKKKTISILNVLSQTYIYFVEEWNG